MEDTICAIATSLGAGAISIIRVSGPEAIPIANEIFKGKDLASVPTHTIHYGKISKDNEVLDEVLLTVMRAPKTYTKEDIVEINCHGGISTTNKVLELLLENGARLAEPGEFTKRAFLNGRIDLLEAESVSDLLNAKTDSARKMALNGLGGRLTKIIKNIRKEILETMAEIEVNIDYPEYEDAVDVDHKYLEPKLKSVENKLKILLKDAEKSKIIKNGIDVALIGRPNVGKSSLMNALLNEDRAIVTDISGTTRDVLEGSTNLNGILLNIIDTAGIRETEDTVEKIGVSKSREMIGKADLVILLLNNNEPLTKEDEELIKQVSHYKHLIFINKNDLETKLVLPKNMDSVIYGNTKTFDGLLDLTNEITREFALDEIESKDLTYLSNARQVSIVKQSLKAIQNAIKNLKETVPIEMLEVDIKESWDLLGELIGETYHDELLDELFSKFCLGK